VDRILVIDDDAELGELVSDYLGAEGFHVDVVGDGLRAVEQILKGGYSLAVLDVMLPSLNGFEVLRRVRARSSVPVLMLTARGDDVDRIVGLEMGADDYLAKPFNPRELAARIRAVLRRTAPRAADVDHRQERLVCGDIVLDPGQRTVRKADALVQLTTVEFDLLQAFLRELGQVITRRDLVRQILGRPFAPYDRSIDVHVSNLRKKLGPHSDGVERIRAIRGVGYLYASPSASAASGRAD
jgi:two-component system response regulator CpxR